jgi:hypothetical protein
MKQRLNRLTVAAAALALPLGAVALATPAMADGHDATVSVLHAIPAGSGADVVDVYAGDTLLIDDFTPGTLETLTVPAGSYDLAVFADGEGPGNGTAVLEAAGVEVPAGANATVTANLSADGSPALNVFVNDTSAIAAGEARLTVRHIAAAPAVDITADGAVLFADLTNPNEAMGDVPAGSYEAAVVLAGTDTVALGPADLDLGEGTNTIVYAWGSAEAGNLALAVQTIDGLGSAPAGVPAGGGSTAAGGAIPLWSIALMVLAAVIAAGAGMRVAVARNR